MKKAPLAEEIFAVLSDSITIKMLKLASTGFRARGGYPSKLKITKKQYSTRLHWKLKAIDSFEKKELPVEEKRKIIDEILSDTVIKECLVNVD